MTLPVVFAIAGFIALLVGLLGGGVKAKEVEIPKISNWVRILLGGIGIVFIGLSIRISPPAISSSPSLQPGNLSNPCFPLGWYELWGAAQWSCDGSIINAYSESGNGFLVSEKSYTKVDLTATVRAMNREASLAFYMQDINNGYLVVFIPRNNKYLENGKGRLSLLVLDKGDVRLPPLGEYSTDSFPILGEDVELAVQASDNIITVFMNGKRVINVTDGTYDKGKIGLRIYGSIGAPCDSKFTDITY